MHVDTQQDCIIRVPVLVVQVMIIVMPGPWTVAQIVEHVLRVDIEADVACHVLLTVRVHVNLVLEPLTNLAGARSLIVPIACVTRVKKVLIVVAHPQAVVKPALRVSTNRMTAPRYNASTVKDAQQVNTERVVVGQTDREPAIW